MGVNVKLHIQNTPRSWYILYMFRQKSIGKFVLLALEKAIDGYVRLEDFMYHPGYYAYGSV